MLGIILNKSYVVRRKQAITLQNSKAHFISPHSSPSGLLWGSPIHVPHKRKLGNKLSYLFSGTLQRHQTLDLIKVLLPKKTCSLSVEKLNLD